MKIYLASDHAGFQLKEALKKHLSRVHAVEDLGTNSDKLCDYPDFIFPLAKNVAKDNESFGIILGGSGQGEAIAANRISGVRAAVYYGGNLEIVKLSRTHNNANILSLGARFLSEKEAVGAVELWLATAFPGDERHVRRIAKIDGR
ncbi:MAG TPA: RpiB/LacA/LacB family sugar-phosphate isomerase [Candidatus Nanoarchaeia archaeon]|nr:RpiB/LacA/LacB family sugar-phosphate isomerase [Candidatus Nanoarchaeia archaeon]